MDLSIYLRVLRNCRLFRNMDDADILSAVENMSPVITGFMKSETVFRDGTLQKKIGIILSGSVKLSHCDTNGNNNLMEILGGGDSFGELNAVGGYKMNLDVTASEDTEILFLAVEHLLRKNVLTAPVQIRFLQNLTLQLAMKAEKLAKKLEESTRRSTRERLEGYLSKEYHKAGKRVFTIPLNRQELADFLFVDRSAMSYELSKMRDEGLLKFDKSRFELLIEMPIAEEEKDPND